MIAVGAGHLAGKDSVIEMLKKRRLPRPPPAIVDADRALLSIDKSSPFADFARHFLIGSVTIIAGYRAGGSDARSGRMRGFPPRMSRTAASVRASLIQRRPPREGDGWSNLLVAAALAAATPAAHRAAEAPADANPAIFVVRDADTTIYIFGTFHALDGQSDWFNDQVKDAFEQSNELVLETLIPEGPADRSRRQLPAFRAAVGDAVGLVPRHDAHGDQRRPSQGMQVGNGADMVLRHDAEAEGKPVEGLETLAIAARHVHPDAGGARPLAPRRRPAAGRAEPDGQPVEGDGATCSRRGSAATRASSCACSASSSRPRPTPIG